MQEKLIAVFLLVFVGCASPSVCGFKEEQLAKWYVPTSNGADRHSVPCEHVAYLDEPPTNRTYSVLGWVAPPAKFRSWGEAINAARAAPSLHGADAVFIDQQQIASGGWEFSAGVGFASGGSLKGKVVQVRYKVIAWDK